MACFKIGDIIPSVGNIKAGSTDVIRIMNGAVQVWPCDEPASCIYWAIGPPDESYTSYVYYFDCSGIEQNIFIAHGDPSVTFCVSQISSYYLAPGSNMVNTETPCAIDTSGNICGTWSSTMNPLVDSSWESLVSGSVDFSSALNPGETISTQTASDGFSTNIFLNSYTSIQLNTYSIPTAATWTDSSNTVDFNFTNLQGTDDKPVDTLYFTGTIYTDAGRRLFIDITSQYGLFIPGTSGGGTSYAQSC